MIEIPEKIPLKYFFVEKAKKKKIIKEYEKSYYLMNGYR